MCIYKRYILAVVGIILSIVMCGCGKSVKLWQCQGSTDEERAEVFLETKYNEDVVIEDVIVVVVNDFYGVKRGEAHLADDPRMRSFPFWLKGKGYDARYLLDIWDDIQTDVDIEVQKHFDDYYLYVSPSLAADGYKDIKFRVGKDSLDRFYAMEQSALRIYLCLPEETDIEQTKEKMKEIHEEFNCHYTLGNIYLVDDETLKALQNGEMDFVTTLGEHSIGNMDNEFLCEEQEVIFIDYRRED